MDTLLYVASFVAVVSTLMVITGRNAVHSLLYLIVSLLSVALIFFLLGAPFVAALEVIIYAGAIMVLFVFVLMMLNMGKEAAKRESRLLSPAGWIGPACLSSVLLGEFIYGITKSAAGMTVLISEVTPKEAGLSLFGPYLLGVEIASLLLLSGLIGAFHLGRRGKKGQDGTGGGRS
jgi:NADH-quinone oxidoreductase subunit J